MKNNVLYVLYCILYQILYGKNNIFISAGIEHTGMILLNVDNTLLKQAQAHWSVCPRSLVLFWILGVLWKLGNISWTFRGDPDPNVKKTGSGSEIFVSRILIQPNNQDPDSYRCYSEPNTGIVNSVTFIYKY